MKRISQAILVSLVLTLAGGSLPAGATEPVLQDQVATTIPREMVLQNDEQRRASHYDWLNPPTDGQTFA